MRSPTEIFVVMRAYGYRGKWFVRFVDHGVERQIEALMPLRMGEKFSLTDDGRAAPTR